MKNQGFHRLRFDCSHYKIRLVIHIVTCLLSFGKALQRNSKVKRSHCPCYYYSNSIKTFHVVLEGDLVFKLNPGPTDVRDGRAKHKVDRGNNDIKTVLLNARSLKSLHKGPGTERMSQLSFFQTFVCGNDYDVLGVTETWLNDSIKDTEILEKGYMIYRRDRVGRVGGGVLLAVKSSFPSRRRIDLETELEMVCVELNLNRSSKILISVVHRPPNCNSDFSDHFSTFLINCSRITNSHSIIMGDFNFPDIKWIEHCGFVDFQTSADSIFCETLMDNFFSR